jgi:hypothetical protein
MFSLLALARGVVELGLALARAAERRGDREAGRASLFVEWIEAAKKEADRGQTVRDRLRGELHRDPARLRDDDGFRRD